MTKTHPSPTPVQLELIRAIDAAWSRDGYAPTRRVLAKALDCQPSNVQQTLDRLERDGWVTEEPLQPRTLRLTAAAVQLLEQDGAGSRG